MRPELPATGHLAPGESVRSHGQGPARRCLDRETASDAFHEHLGMAAAEARAEQATLREPAQSHAFRRPVAIPQNEQTGDAAEPRNKGEDPETPPVADPPFPTDAGAAAPPASPAPPLPTAITGVNSPQPAQPIAPAELSQEPTGRDATRNGRPAPNLPVAGKDAAAVVAEVLIVSRETHLAPDSTRTAWIGRPANPDGKQAQVSADGGALAKVGAPTVAAALTMPVADTGAPQGREREQWSARGSPSSSPVDLGVVGADHPGDGDASFDIAMSPSAAGPAENRAAPGLLLPASSTARQIADPIAASLAGAEPARADATPVSPAATATRHPLKVLTIQLHPAELGSVTVRIAVKNDALDLQIGAGRRETARLLDADREALSGLLRAAGYSIDALTIRAVDPPNATPPAGSLPAALQWPSGGSQPEHRPAGGQTHAGQDGNALGTPRDSNDEQSGLRHPAGDGLYV